MMGAYILTPRRPLILGSASGNLYMNLKPNLNLPDLIGLLASDEKKPPYSPMPIETTGSKRGHPARYGYHHCRSCPLRQITLRKSSFGNVQDLRGIRFSDSLTDSISCSATGATALLQRVSQAVDAFCTPQCHFSHIQITAVTATLSILLQLVLNYTSFTLALP